MKSLYIEKSQLKVQEKKKKTKSHSRCVNSFSLQSLDDGRPERPPQQKAPLRQETNMANFSYRFSIYNINGETHTHTHFN